MEYVVLKIIDKTSLYKIPHLCGVFYLCLFLFFQPQKLDKRQGAVFAWTTCVSLGRFDTYHRVSD
jgi:hypothetical protein